MKVIVYTAILNKRDELKEPIEVGSYEYICFSDSVIQSSVYKINVISTDNPRLTARKYKLLPHLMLPDHDISIWHDGSMRVVDLNGLVDELGSESIGLYKHSINRGIYKIIDTCLRNRWDFPKRIKEHRHRYLNLKVPEDIPTFETGILVRKNDLLAASFNECWWSELYSGSNRDQISLPFVLWKERFSYSVLSRNVYTNGYFEFHPHKPAEVSIKLL